MRRIIVVLMVAALIAAMLAVTAVPAFATIHPLSKSERSNAPEGTQGFVSAEIQDPPGLSAGEIEGIPIVQPKNPNQSSNSAKLNEDGAEGNLAQPIFVANENAFKPEG
jgi:hypothetical protein